MKTDKLSNNKNATEIFLLPIIFLWIGLVLGISFIEDPLKFQAPGVSLKIGLGIEKLVFPVLNKVEIILLLSIFPTLFLYKKNRIGAIIMCFI